MIILFNEGFVRTHTQNENISWQIFMNCFWLLCMPEHEEVFVSVSQINSHKHKHNKKSIHIHGNGKCLDESVGFYLDFLSLCLLHELLADCLLFTRLFYILNLSLFLLFTKVYFIHSCCCYCLWCFPGFFVIQTL